MSTSQKKKAKEMFHIKEEKTHHLNAIPDTRLEPVILGGTQDSCSNWNADCRLNTAV